MCRMAQVAQFSQAANFLQPAVLSSYALRHLELGTDRNKTTPSFLSGECRLHIATKDERV